jgi:hypothetical protein
MKQILVCLAAIVCIAAFSTVAHAQCGVLGVECLINGNLDIGTAGGAGLPGTAPPWTLTNTGNATAAQFQPDFADNTGVNGIWYRSFLGGPTMQEPNRPLVSANLSQTTLPVTAAGTYQLQFERVVENNFMAGAMTATLSSSSGPSVTRNLLLDKITAATYTGGGFDTVATTAPGYNINVAMNLPGVLAGDTLTVSLAMVDGDDSGTNPQSVVADNFRLARVPEPASAVLGLIGVFGLLGVARRR